MFITGRSWYDSSGQQHARGKILMIFDDPNSKDMRPELRACVRTVSYRALGHFMMGTVRLAGRVISLSGSYGDDGLPISMPYKDLSEKVVQHIWNSLCNIPKSLQDEFWSGGGHNSAGKEAHSMKKWALENLKELSKPIKVIDN